MAKMLRWERAWRHFTNEFCGVTRYRGGSYSRKRSERRRRDYGTYYWVLIKEARGLDIKVYLKDDLGESRDFHGETFRVGGTWNGRQQKIRLLYRSFPTLAHEFAHAVDEILGGKMWVPEHELVACGAGYLLTCAAGGIVSPAFDVAYAKRQGARERDLFAQEERTLSVFREMATLVNVSI